MTNDVTRDPRGLFAETPEAKYRLVRGHVLHFPSGVAGGPIEYRGDGWWRVVVVGGGHEAYPVGGHGIHVSPAERITVE